MQARLIAYPPDNAAVTRWIEPGDQLRVGRAPDCGLSLDHPSVSRGHAELAYDDAGWRLRDLGSKNGSFVDGIPARDVTLNRSGWLRFGDVHCEITLFEPAHAAAVRGREQERRALSVALTRQIGDRVDSDTLPDDILRGVLELAGCSRGFVLLADGQDYAVRASLVRDGGVLDANALKSRTFSGSVGAVQRALAQREPVAINQVASDPWLSGRESVVAMGLHSLVCLPLLDGKRVLGAVYADRREPGEPITQLDLELLGAFAESAAVWLLAGQALAVLDAAPRWNTIVSAHARGAAA